MSGGVVFEPGKLMVVKWEVGLKQARLGQSLK